MNMRFKGELNLNIFCLVLFFVIKKACTKILYTAHEIKYKSILSRVSPLILSDLCYIYHLYCFTQHSKPSLTLHRLHAFKVSWIIHRSPKLHISISAISIPKFYFSTKGYGAGARIQLMTTSQKKVGAERTIPAAHIL